VVKLHVKLGKPIPSVDPTVITKGDGGGGGGHQRAQSTVATATSAPAAGNANVVGGQTQAQIYRAVHQQPQPVVQKINFVPAAPPSSEHATSVSGLLADKPTPLPLPLVPPQQVEVNIPRFPDERDVRPVGHEYIEEMRNADGKVTSFNCKLCECRFNDPNAKEMHMKGRRHRLQFKKKVDPDLVVDLKPSLRQRKVEAERARRAQDLWKWRREAEEEDRSFWNDQRGGEEAAAAVAERLPPRQGGSSSSAAFAAGMGPGCNGPPLLPPPFAGSGARPGTDRDRSVMAKHAEIFPGGESLERVQRAVAAVEKALKAVSDSMAEEDGAASCSVGTAGQNEYFAEGHHADEDNQKHRLLKGVMRVGVLANGLIISGDNFFKLVVLCGARPTHALLDRIADALQTQIEAPGVAVSRSHDEGSITVTHEATEEFETIHVEIAVTSPLVREESINKVNPDELDRRGCLAALAALR